MANSNLKEAKAVCLQSETVQYVQIQMQNSLQVLQSQRVIQ